MEDCFKHSSLIQNFKNKNMKTKTKYLLNVEGKRKYKANSFLGLLLNVVKGNHERRNTTTKGKR